ncbi:hypothetical protein ECO26H__500164 [Escherichia coli O26:H11]|nr:hypothetical protein ECO26H__500164 [Escherichia coli O26:H11]
MVPVFAVSFLRGIINKKEREISLSYIKLLYMTSILRIHVPFYKKLVSLLLH